MTAIRVPPGRAGLLWLRHRLEAATRGAALLEQKLRILRQEERRLALLVQHSGEEWEAGVRDAETWLLRAALAGGQQSVEQGVADGPATVTLMWASTMGVSYPAEAICAFPGRGPGSAAVLGGAALIRAEAAYRDAADAAVRHAAALAAVRALGAETAATRQRARALRRHWIPRLDAALAATQLGLDEQEHAEGVQRRWAAGAQQASGEAEQ